MQVIIAGAGHLRNIQPGHFLQECGSAVVGICYHSSVSTLLSSTLSFPSVQPKEIGMACLGSPNVRSGTRQHLIDAICIKWCASAMYAADLAGPPFSVGFLGGLLQQG